MLGLLLMVLVLVLAEHWITTPPPSELLGDAAWIWVDPPSVRPRAAFLVRDLTLNEIPPQLELLVGADEEYLLFLNGRRVGSGVFAPHQLIDRYDVSGWLGPGKNRLVAEVRSSRGAGGFLACLRPPGAEECLVATDGRWQSFETYDEGLLRGWSLLAGGRPARVWGRPPIARWPVPAAAVDRPTFPSRLGLPALEARVRMRDILGEGIERVLEGVTEVEELLRLARSPDDARLQLEHELGLAEIDAEALVAIFERRGRLERRDVRDGLEGRKLSVVDWGEIEEGFPTLRFGPSSRAPVGWISPGAQRPSLAKASFRRSLVGIAGQPVWRSPRPYRLRYLVVLSTEAVVEGWLDPVLGAGAQELSTMVPVISPLFGLPVDPLRSPVEDELWGEL